MRRPAACAVAPDQLDAQAVPIEGQPAFQVWYVQPDAVHFVE